MNSTEDLQPEEWKLMIEYFGTDSKFQVISKLTFWSIMYLDEMACLIGHSLFL
jgi:hypothetical protein